jgi:cytochrome c556
MKIGKSASLFSTAFVLILAGGIALAQDAPPTPRQAAMKEMGGAMKAIKGIVDAGGPASDVAAPAQKIAEASAKLAALFPEGSDTPDDGSKPEIWANWADFEAKANALTTEATALAGLAAGGDMEAIGAQFKKTGGTCGSCHETYRAKKE